MISILLVSEDSSLMEAVQGLAQADVSIAHSLETEATYDLCLLDVASFGWVYVEQWRHIAPLRILIGDSAQADKMVASMDDITDLWFKPLPAPLIQKRITNLFTALSLMARIQDNQRSLGDTLHDLKNPIATVRGYSDVLLNMSGQTDKLPPLVESQHKFIAAIYNASGKMEILVDNLRDRNKSSSE